MVRTGYLVFATGDPTVIWGVHHLRMSPATSLEASYSLTPARRIDE